MIVRCAQVNTAPGPSRPTASADGSGECHDLDAACTSFPERGRGGGRSRSTRVDIVDEAHARWRGSRGREDSGDVRAALPQAETALPVDAAETRDEGFHGQIPEAPERASERLRRPVTALEHALGIGGDEGESGYRWASKRLRDEVGGFLRESPLRILLPGRDEAAGTLVVEDGRASGDEAEASAGTLGATTHRPVAG